MVLLGLMNIGSSVCVLCEGVMMVTCGICDVGM